MTPKYRLSAMKMRPCRPGDSPSTGASRPRSDTTPLFFLYIFFARKRWRNKAFLCIFLHKHKKSMALFIMSARPRPFPPSAPEPPAPSRQPPTARCPAISQKTPECRAVVNHFTGDPPVGFRARQCRTIDFSE
jgi:hypothetical protein